MNDKSNILLIMISQSSTMLKNKVTNILIDLIGYSFNYKYLINIYIFIISAK